MEWNSSLGRVLILIIFTLIRVQQATGFTDFLEINERLDHCSDARTDLERVQDDLFAMNFSAESINHHGDSRQVVYNLGKINGLLIGNSIARGAVTDCGLRQWGYHEPSRTFELANNPMQNETLCKKGLNELYNFMKSYEGKNIDNGRYNHTKKDSRFYLQLSSFGRAPLGALEQMNIWIGDYDACMRLDSTRYCYAAYKTKRDDNIILPLYNRTRDYPKDFQFIRIGICIPESCTDKIGHSFADMEKIEEIVFFNFPEGFNLTDPVYHQIDEIYCPPTRHSEWQKVTRDPLSVAILCLASMWCLTLTYCMISKTSQCDDAKFGRGHTSDTARDWRRFFDLSQHSRDFFRAERQIPELNPIDLLKVISMCMIMINHAQVGIMTVSRNLHVVQGYKLGAIFFQGQHNVSMFFMASAFLVAYARFRSPKKPLRPMEMVVKRYIRLIPMYLIVYAIIKQFSHAWNSGPFWDHGVSQHSTVRRCQSESWLIPTLMLANCVRVQSHCILTGWFLATDYQLYCLVTLLLIVYRRSKACGRSIAISIFLLQQVGHFYFSNKPEKFSEETYANIVIFGATMLSTRVWLDYGTPVGRIGQAYLGVLLADAVHCSISKLNLKLKTHVESADRLETYTEAGSDAKMTRRDVIANYQRVLFRFLPPITLATLAVCYCSAFLAPTLRDYSLAPNYNQAISYTILSFGADFGWFWLFYWLILGRQKQLLDVPMTSWCTDICNARLWTVLAKLNLIVMLTHDAVIKYLTQSTSTYLDYNYTTLFLWSGLVIIVSYAIGAIMYVCIEAPLTQLSRILLDQNHQSSRKLATNGHHHEIAAKLMEDAHSHPNLSERINKVQSRN